MLDIHHIMKSLAETRPIFHIEADFQFALAWHVKELIPNCEVRPEFKHSLEEDVYLDIWLPNIGTVIEVKYYTKEFDFKIGVEQFALKNQGAQPLRRYDFVKDIERLERIVVEKSDCKSGLAVLLTNDAAYWKAPSSRWRSSVDAAFRVHDNSEVGGRLEWSEHTGTGTKRNREEPITLTDSYTLRWQDYSKVSVPHKGNYRREDVLSEIESFQQQNSGGKVTIPAELLEALQGSFEQTKFNQFRYLAVSVGD